MELQPPDLAGFSLVELIIVLAIAGLIMILAFVGFAQGNHFRHQDAQKADAARYLEAEKLWVSDNDGILPTSVNYNDPVTGILAKYITANGATFKAPDGTTWSLAWRTPGVGPNSPAGNDIMLVGSGSTCSGAGIADGGPRQFAVMFNLESGGTYCTSN